MYKKCGTIEIKKPKRHCSKCCEDQFAALRVKGLAETSCLISPSWHSIHFTSDE